MILDSLRDNKDPSAWLKYVSKQKTDDLLLWLNIQIKMEEYEIAAIIRDELGKRERKKTATNR